MNLIKTPFLGVFLFSKYLFQEMFKSIFNTV
jgi:hypothetical protein